MLSAYCASSSGIGDFLKQRESLVGMYIHRWGKYAWSMAIHLLLHPFSKRLLSAYYMPDSVLGAWYIAVNQRWNPALVEVTFQREF